LETSGAVRVSAALHCPQKRAIDPLRCPQALHLIPRDAPHASQYSLVALFWQPQRRHCIDGPLDSSRRLAASTGRYNSICRSILCRYAIRSSPIMSGTYYNWLHNSEAGKASVASRCASDLATLQGPHYTTSGALVAACAQLRMEASSEADRGKLNEMHSNSKERSRWAR
jgi:hypothetical protein